MDNTIADEVARTESNRMPDADSRAAVKVQGRNIIQVDVSDMSTRDALAALEHYDDIFIPVKQPSVGGEPEQIRMW